MRTRSLLVCTILVISVLIACSRPVDAPASADSPGTAKNVILLVGDGMGPSFIGLAKDYARVIEGRELWMAKAISEGHLALMQVPALGTLVTDSAASGTAMATGERVRNGKISLGADGKPLATLLELAMKDSRGAGLVTTTRLTHATPACFAAHVGRRNAENEIAEQLIASGADVLLGGGLRNFIPRDMSASDFAEYEGGSKRGDDKNLVEKARQAGYRFVTDRNELAAARGTAKLLGLFAGSHLPYVLDRRPDDGTQVPSLVEMTEAALGILSKNENGFFLLVEGGRIDHAAHANDAAATIADTMEFDEAVGAAMAFAEKDGSTAVFITADHVTGGPCLTARYSDELGKTVYPDDSNLRRIARQDASFEYILTEFSKNISPAELKRLVSKHAGVELTDADVALVLKGDPLTPFHVIKPKYRRFGYPALALGRVLGVEYGIAWAGGKHFAEPVLLIGYGAHADGVHGYIENTDTFTIMKEAGGL